MLFLSLVMREVDWAQLGDSCSGSLTWLWADDGWGWRPLKVFLLTSLYDWWLWLLAGHSHVLSPCSLGFPTVSGVSIPREPGGFDQALDITKNHFVHSFQLSQFQAEEA